MNTDSLTPASDPSLVYPSPLKEFWQAFSRNKGAVGGLLFMLVIVFCALFAPWVAPHDPSEQFRDFLLTPPLWLEVATRSSCWAPTSWAATCSRA